MSNILFFQMLKINAIWRIGLDCMIIYYFFRFAICYCHFKDVYRDICRSAEKKKRNFLKILPSPSANHNIKISITDRSGFR